ncbi:MAG: ABC transporter permease [Thermoplasmatota archaeon]|nr:ABC transporter permease subunit [Halobacteriales archaeon]
MRPSAWLAALPVAFVAVAFVLPMAQTLAAAGSSVCGTCGTALAYATTPYVRHVLKVALVQAAWSTVLALALALPLAWLHHARRLPWPRLQLAVHAAPFVMPVFVVVYGLQITLGPRGWLHAATGLDALGWLGPLGTVVLAHAYYNYGFAARLIDASLRRRPRVLEAAARTLGASPRQAFLRTTLPLLTPAILAVALLVFLFTFGSFGVVLFMGGGHVETLETAMYGKVQTLFADLPRAAVLGILELAVNGLLLLGYVALRRRIAPPSAEPETPARPAGRGLAALSLAVTAAAALPLAAVLVQGFRLDGQWSLAPWRYLLAGPHGFDLAAALRLSLLYALASTTLALLLAAALAYGSRAAPRLRRPLEALASLPMAGSGILLGVAFLATFGVGGLMDIEGTVWIVLLAHTVLAFPFVARILLPAFEARDVRFGEAARLLGAPPRAVAWRVHGPLLRPALVAAAGLAAALSLGDYGASSLLMGQATRGLSVWIAEVDGPFVPIYHAAAVALAGLLCALTLAAYLAVERMGTEVRA